MIDDARPSTLGRRPFRTRGGAILDFTALGFGGAPLGNMHRRIDEAEARATVRAAWDLGLRYFDTAPLYGHGLSEQRIGAALAGEARADFLLSTKVGRVLEPCAPGDEASGIYVDTPPLRVRWDYRRDGILRSFESSLARLGVNRVDILYVHDIEAAAHGSEAEADARMRDLIDGGGWAALDDLRAAGLVGAIGAGVNSCAPCERLLALADPDLFLLAGRYTLLDQSAQERLLPACAARGVGVVLGGPYNSGILVTGPRPGALYDYAPAPEAILDRARRIEAIARRHRVALATAALQFPLAHPAVVSVIPGGQTRGQVEQALAAVAAPIPPAFWSDLADGGLLAASAPVPAPC